MGVQKERISTFLTAFEHREKKECSLFLAQYWYRSCLWMSLSSESSVSNSSELLIFLSIEFLVTDETFCNFPSTTIQSYYRNLSDGVTLIVWFTTNGMCVKNNTIIYVAWASNNKRDCDAWSLLLLAAAVRSFAHMPLSTSDGNTFSNAMQHQESHEQ